LISDGLVEVPTATHELIEGQETELSLVPAAGTGLEIQSCPLLLVVRMSSTAPLRASKPPPTTTQSVAVVHAIALRKFVPRGRTRVAQVFPPSELAAISPDELPSGTVAVPTSRHRVEDGQIKLV
jgi:hypothetical protein